MPTSNRENSGWMINQILSSNISTILDVGAGMGTYALELSLSGYSGKIYASEIWEPYVNLFKLDTLYTEIYVEDIRERSNFKYDLIIFGDVLEHMDKNDCISIWSKVSKQAKYCLISIPIIHCPQGPIMGNPYETHIKDDWTHEEVINTFYGINNYIISRTTASYWADFNLY